MTFEKRAWFVIDVFILVLVLLTTRLIYWQMVRGNDLLSLGEVSGVSEDLETATDSDRVLIALSNGDISLDNSARSASAHHPAPERSNGGDHPRLDI